MGALSYVIWLALAVTVVDAFTAPITAPPTVAAPSVVRAVSTRVPVAMQYGGGYGQQQQQYNGGGSPRQTRYSSVQEKGYIAVQTFGEKVWRIHGFAGVQGHNRVATKYGELPYTLINHGPSEQRVQVLSRWNMIAPSPYVSRVQCSLELRADGTPVLTSNGKAPTLVRPAGGQWNALYKGQKYALTSGDQVSLDCYNPDGAVFTCVDESAPQQGGGGGYPQQGGGGYPQQGGGGYSQQGGGYPQGY